MGDAGKTFGSCHFLLLGLKALCLKRQHLGSLVLSIIIPLTYFSCPHLYPRPAAWGLSGMN